MVQPFYIDFQLFYILMRIILRYYIIQDLQLNFFFYNYRTKRMVVDVIACEPAENIMQMLENNSTDDQVLILLHET